MSHLWTSLSQLWTLMDHLWISFGHLWTCVGYLYHLWILFWKVLSTICGRWSRLSLICWHLSELFVDYCHRWTFVCHLWAIWECLGICGLLIIQYGICMPSVDFLYDIYGILYVICGHMWAIWELLGICGHLLPFVDFDVSCLWTFCHLWQQYKQPTRPLWPLL